VAPAADPAAGPRRAVPQVRRRLTGTVSGGLGSGRARRLAMPLGALGLVALVIGGVLGAELPASSRGASQPAKSSGAASVQRRNLVATDTESGTLGYAHQQTVYNRLTGTITWLPVVGHVVDPGQTLYKVDNGPVVLFNGTTPAYRTLSSGVSDGPDVQELNQNLVQLGFDPSRQISVDQTWQSATTAAVDRWQAALGETQTGTVTLGQIVFLPAPQLVTTVQTVLGSTGGSSGSSSTGSTGSTSASSTGASLTTVAPQPQFVSLTTTPSSTTTTGSTGPTGPSGAKPGSSKGKPSSSSALSLQALVALLKAEIAELRKSASATGSTSRTGASASGSAGSAHSSGGGSASTGGGTGGSSSGSGAAASGSSGAASAQAILQTTSTQEVVTVALDATKQTEAVVGAPVTVQLPDGSTVNGKITQVSPVAQSSSSSSASGGAGAGGSGSSSTPTATIPVTITLTGRTRLSGLDQAAVSVNFAQQRANNVLSVPVTALIATQGGAYAVQEATSPRRLIPVTPGLFAAGYVQISGSGIYPGLQVTDSQG
jgi:hypothetical protein